MVTMGGPIGFNKDYYRQRATYLIQQSFFKPLRFWLKNRGGIGARDVYIDMIFKSGINNVILINLSNFPNFPPSEYGFSFGASSKRHVTKPEEIIREGSDSWRTNIEVKALQPQRELSPTSDLLIGALDICEVIIAAKIYADTLAEPIIQELKLRLNVKKFNFTAKEFMDIIQPGDEGEEKKG